PAGELKAIGRLDDAARSTKLAELIEAFEANAEMLLVVQQHVGRVLDLAGVVEADATIADLHCELRVPTGEPRDRRLEPRRGAGPGLEIASRFEASITRFAGDRRLE